MQHTAKTIHTAGLFAEDENPFLDLMDETDSDFLKAFCELLEIQDQSKGAPIVMLPKGPAILH